MSVKPLELGELLKDFAEYLTMSDILAAKALAKISAIISKKRVDKRMSQKQFAEFMGVSQGMVSKWESEDYNFSIEALARICDKLDLQLEIEMKSDIDQYKQNFITKKVVIDNKNKLWKQAVPICFEEDTYSEAV